MDAKQFDQWNERKKRLEQSVGAVSFKEREVWWCSVGANLGSEVMGKGAQFSRPVLVLNKHNRKSFFGLPLSSTRKIASYLFPLFFHDRHGSVLLSQGRTYSSKRLIQLVGTLPEPKFGAVRDAFRTQFENK